MKYKVGDRVRIKSIDWYNENINNKGVIVCGSESFTHPMSHFCNEVVNIITIQDNCYRIFEDGGDWYWTDEMIEGLAEEEVLLNIDDFQDDNEIIDIIDEYVHRLKDNECQINLPEGYQFKDENGNVINATKIVLEKKKNGYPKTYEECCKVLNIAVRDLDILDNMLDTTEIVYRKNLDRLLNSFRKLLICRDAYWKIVGDEMGLEKPWEPDYTEKTLKHCLRTNYGRIVQTRTSHDNHPLTFPTEEMRDAFYENFKELIEQCKELL